MKKSQPTRPSGDSEKELAIDRRTFLKLMPAAGTASLAGAASLTLTNLDVISAYSEQASQEVPDRIKLEMLRPAEQIIGIELTGVQEGLALPGVNRNLVNYESLRKIDIPLDTEPATAFHPALPGKKFGLTRAKLKSSKIEALKFKTVEELAFCTVTQLAELVRTKQVSPVALTKMYLERLKKYGPALLCVVTLTEELALKHTQEAEREIRRGKYRTPLHGIPCGVKDRFAATGM